MKRSVSGQIPNPEACTQTRREEGLAQTLTLKKPRSKTRSLGPNLTLNPGPLQKRDVSLGQTLTLKKPAPKARGDVGLGQTIAEVWDKYK